jgi:hypothetical protein
MGIDPSKGRYLDITPDMQQFMEEQSKTLRQISCTPTTVKGSHCSEADSETSDNETSSTQDFPVMVLRVAGQLHTE